MKQYTPKIEQHENGYYFPDYDIDASDVEVVLDKDGKEIRRRLSLEEVKARVLKGHGINVNKNPKEN